MMASQGSFIDRHMEHIAQKASTHWSPESCEVQLELGNHIITTTDSIPFRKFDGRFVACVCYPQNMSTPTSHGGSNFIHVIFTIFMTLATSSHHACGLMSNAAKLTALALQLDQCAQRTYMG